MAGKKNPSAKRSSRKNRYERIAIWGIVVSIIAIGLLLWGPWHKGRRTAERKPVQTAKKQEQVQPPKEIAGVVAIVIDDLGQDLKPAQELLALPDRVTLAVMPGLPQSRRIAELAHKQGREVLVHLPMEAKGRAGRPAPGMLRSDMTPMEFLGAVNDDLDSVPGAAGVNNHEGSALTENREAMNFLMSELKTRNLFLLDSLTTPKSTAYAAAKEFGLKAAKRDVFLDNDSNHPSAIRKQLAELSRIAREHGKAIGIGHPHPSTLAELEHWLPKAAEQGIEVVPVSRLMQ